LWQVLHSDNILYQMEEPSVRLRGEAWRFRDAARAVDNAPHAAPEPAQPLAALRWLTYENCLTEDQDLPSLVELAPSVVEHASYSGIPLLRIIQEDPPLVKLILNYLGSSVRYVRHLLFAGVSTWRSLVTR